MNAPQDDPPTTNIATVAKYIMLASSLWYLPSTKVIMLSIPPVHQSTSYTTRVDYLFRSMGGVFSLWLTWMDGMDLMGSPARIRC